MHQRCNLACDYCYVYELADQSWRDRPRVISPALWRAAARRIGEHAARHDLPHVRVTLHGGEPLLAGVTTLAQIAADLRAAVPCPVTVGLQTNGTALSAATLAALAEAEISVAVSLDGVGHDKHRRFPSGDGSFRAVSAALSLLCTSSAYAGLLCVIDPSSDPVATYESLIEWQPPAIDFLLPHANWASPPSPGCGAWLASVFDRWYDAPRRETSVRLFEDLMSLLLGGPGRSEQAGLAPVSVAVIETDGSLEQVDALKSAYSGAASTGLSVLTSSLDDLLLHPGMVARQIGPAALAPSCLACPVASVCGAGHYAHRYRPGSGFRHPTVYCEDMFLLIGHIRRRLASSLSVAL